MWVSSTTTWMKLEFTKQVTKGQDTVQSKIGQKEAMSSLFFNFNTSFHSFLRFE